MLTNKSLIKNHIYTYTYICIYALENFHFAIILFAQLGLHLLKNLIIFMLGVYFSYHLNVTCKNIRYFPFMLECLFVHVFSFVSVLNFQGSYFFIHIFLIFQNVASYVRTNFPALC